MDIKKQLKENKFSDKPRMISQVIIFDLLLITAGALGLLSSDIFLLAFFFIILPALFSTHLCLSTIKIDKHVITNKEFWKGFCSYFSNRSPIFGAYQVLKGILKSILVYFVISLIFSTIYIQVGGQGFTDGVNSLIEAMSSNNLEEVENLMTNNASISKFYSLSTLVCLGGASVFFVFHVLKNFLNVNTRMITGVFGPRRGNLVFKRVWKQNRSVMLGDLFKYGWFVFLGIFVFTGVGAAVSYICGLASPIALIIGIIAGLLYFSICLPYYVCLIEILCDKYIPLFQKEIKLMVDEISTQISLTNEMNNEEKKNLDQLKKMIDKMCEEDSEEDKPDENSDDKKE